MPHYLVQVAYTPEAWAAQIRQPASRVEAVRPLLERLGARFEATYLAIGQYDVVFIMGRPTMCVPRRSRWRLRRVARSKRCTPRH